MYEVKILILIQMGNTQQEEKFDPKMMEEHQKKMREVQGQYQNHQLAAPGAYFAHQTEKK